MYKGITNVWKNIKRRPILDQKLTRYRKRRVLKTGVVISILAKLPYLTESRTINTIIW